MREYLKKQRKKRDQRLRYDFLPSMIEIIEKPANQIGSMILYLVIALIMTMIVWAFLARLDIAVTAVGAAQPEDAVVTLMAQNTDRICSIEVKDGEFVHAGDEICRMDADEAEVSLQENLYEQEVLSVQQEIYKELYEKLKADDYTDWETDTERFGENARIAEAVVLEYQNFLDSLDSMGYLEKQEAKKTELLTVLQNLNTAETKLKSISYTITQEEMTIEKSSILAPSDGTFTAQGEYYEGKTLAAGDVIGYIMPEDAADVFEAYVADEDIGQIAAGNRVRVRIAAYADTEYEYIDGKILAVGDVAVQIDGIGNAYSVKVGLETVPEDIRAGMEGSMDIIVGTRTVMDYFLEPFRRGLEDSLKER